MGMLLRAGAAARLFRDFVWGGWVGHVTVGRSLLSPVLRVVGMFVGERFAVGLPLLVIPAAG